MRVGNAPLALVNQSGSRLPANRFDMPMEATMSINTLTSNAVIARAQNPASGIDPDKISPSGTGPLSMIANYIPTEILSVYLAALSLIAQANVSAASPGGLPSQLETIKVITFLVGFSLTPVVVWCAFAMKIRAAGGAMPLRPTSWPWWSIFAATLSFAIWAMALPSSGIADHYLGGYGNLVAGILVLVVGAMLSMFAPLFSASPPDGSAAADQASRSDQRAAPAS
jgi:hypothetical protein